MFLVIQIKIFREFKQIVESALLVLIHPLFLLIIGNGIFTLIYFQ